MHRWYSMSRECKVVDHDPVTLDEAIVIAHDYFGRADAVYETAEEGTEATMFGIGSNSTIIEFGLISSSHISCALKSPGSQVHGYPGSSSVSFSETQSSRPKHR